MMKTANLYIRVSTDEQADKGYSQRGQEEILRKYCEINQISIRRVIFEDHSAKTFNRPAWTRLLIELKKSKIKSDLILFTKWDRFSRNAGDAYHMISILRKINVEPQAIEQPLDLTIPENKMMLAFYLAAPEVENDRRALNVMFGMRRARKEGRWMGAAPFGYINKITELGRKYIEPKEPEAGIIKWVFNEIVKERNSVNSIWNEARAKGLKCSKNSLWVIVRNPVYCGKIFVSKLKEEESHYVTGQHEGIISESLFLEVQDVLDGKHRSYFSKKESHALQLRGHLLCPICQKVLTGSTSRGRSRRYSYYHCVYPCKVRIKADQANSAFISELVKYVPRPGMQELYIEICKDVFKQRTRTDREDLTKLKEDLSRESARLIKARDLLLNEEIDSADYKSIKLAGERKIADLENKLFSAGRIETNIGPMLDKAFKTLSNLETLYQDADLKTKRRIIGSIFPEKLVFNGNNYRTARVNEAVQLIFNVGEGFSENKNGQTEVNFDLSTQVNRIGFEPMTPSLEGLCSIQLSYRSIKWSE
jgi:site-specific DNA recombinase